MFEHYSNIFNKRGASYHEAMTLFPNARDQEFVHITDILQLQDGDTLVDIPSGAGYIKHYINKDVNLILVDSSKEFLSFSSESDKSICCDVTQVPLPSNSVDKINSLAGIHHLEDKIAFYNEVYRLLKHNGIFALADVELGSAVDGFLNEFVDNNNSMGHKGIFINRENTVQSLKEIGFSITSAKMNHYYWNFNSVKEMVTYTGLLFGIDNATEQEIHDGIKNHLGYKEHDKGASMNWQLLYFNAQKI